jgi:hypothetical protein
VRHLQLIASLVAAVLPLALLGCGTADTATGPSPSHPICGAVDLAGGGGAPLPPDGPSLCAPGACNYQTQQGCGAEEACRPLVSADATAVAPGCEASGKAGAGEPCVTSGECARGFACVGESAESRACRRLCCGADWSACDPGESCIRQLYLALDGDHREYAADLCFPVDDCDPFDPKACADATRECKIVDPTGAVACAPRSDAKLGDPCDEANGCAQGFSCVGLAGGERTCRRLCRAEQCGDPQCPADEGTTCVHFDRDPAGVGECVPRKE